MGKSLEYVAIMACMTPLLMLFNFVFWVSGVLMLIIGVWMRTELYDYIDISNDSNGVGASLIALAVLGAIVVTTSMLACCCTARGHPALLYLYGAFLAVVALLELAAGASVYAYRNSLNKGFDVGLNNSINAYGDDATKTAHIDTMQNTLHCCGNRAYTDWTLANPPKEIPSSCCNVPEGECDIKNINDIYTQGCYNLISNFISSNVGLVAGSAVGVAVFPLAGVFLACCLANNINKTKYEQVA